MPMLVQFYEMNAAFLAELERDGVDANAITIVNKVICFSCCISSRRLYVDAFLRKMA